MFNSLSEKLTTAFKHLKGQSSISELNVANTIKEIRKALLDADVNFSIAKEFTDKIKEKAIGLKVINSISPGQLMTKIVQDELTHLMGDKQEELQLNKPLNIILVVGLQGNGKTTFAGKLALYLKNNKKKPLIVAGDVYRPAAIEQLQILGKQIDVDVYAETDNKNVVEIAENAIQFAKENNKNVIIIDTAGRLAIDEIMMNEVSNIKNAVNPSEILFVIDAMTGQDAVLTAKTFNDKLNFTGVVVTKMDGDTRGGAALTVKYTVQKPIKFISNGEKMEALDIFHPDRIAQRILGMGDITSLVEKAQAQFSEEQAKKLEKKIRKNQFDFHDFLEQIQQIKKLGSIKDIMGMLPGVNKLPANAEIDDNAFKKIEAIIQSMTPFERANPDVLNQSRKIRIAKGCGKKIEEVNAFIKQFEQMKSMMKKMNNMSNFDKLMPKF